MQSTARTLSVNKHIALVAHDHCKQDLINWCKTHRTLLAQHTLYATGTTGNLIQKKQICRLKVYSVVQWAAINNWAA